MYEAGEYQTLPRRSSHQATQSASQPVSQAASQPRGTIETECVYLSRARSCSCSLHGPNSQPLLQELSNIINTAINLVKRKSAGGYSSRGVHEAFRIILGSFNAM